MIKKAFWNILGFLSLGMAYLGVILPGLPCSPFVVFSAYCFGKGSERMHRWLYNHRLFGPFLTNWGQKRVFPTKMKYFMLAMMSLSLYLISLKHPAERVLELILTSPEGVRIFETAFLVPSNAVLYTGTFMALVAVWAWRFPGSVEEWQRRTDNNERIGWLK